MKDLTAKCEIDEKDALFKLELKEGIWGGGGGGGGGIVYVIRLNLGQGRFWKMGPDKGTIDRDGR